MRKIGVVVGPICGVRKVGAILECFVASNVCSSLINIRFPSRVACVGACIQYTVTIVSFGHYNTQSISVIKLLQYKCYRSGYVVQVSSIQRAVIASDFLFVDWIQNSLYAHHHSFIS